MSIFYLLPDRAAVAAHFARYLDGWFPGAGQSAADLADRLAVLIESQSDAYAVFADELADADDPAAVLREWYGAEPGDCVIDLRGGPRPVAVPRPTRPVGADDIFPPRLTAAC